MANLSQNKGAKIGEIWTCFEGEKISPVLIIKEGLTCVELDINIARLTSQLPKNEFDVEIKHWKEAGLDVVSYVRCSKINTVHQMALKRKIGTLVVEDLETVKAIIRKYFE